MSTCRCWNHFHTVCQNCSTHPETPRVRQTVWQIHQTNIEHMCKGDATAQTEHISKQISSTAQQYSFWGVIIRASGASNNIVLETRTGDNSAQSVSNAPTKPERGVIARICRQRVVIKSNNSAHFCLDFIAKTNRGVVRCRGTIKI